MRSACGYESSANYAKDVVSFAGYPRIIIIIVIKPMPNINIDDWAVAN